MSKSLMLNMIVRNESARIERALASAAPYISSWCIADTGSTDDTKEKIQKFFVEKNIPGLLVHCKFKDFSQARNIALTCARHSPLPHDYILLFDADMELRVNDLTWLDDVKGDSYDMFQTAGTMQYANRRLVKSDAQGLYVGVTHEYLNVESGGCIPPAKADFLDHADGSNRVEKFKRDIRLLKDAMKTEPKNVRYMYYLAQSYRDAGKHEKAAKWYKRRVDAGGWDEEVWSAQECYAACLGTLGDENGFVAETLKAYQMRPARAETLFDLARHFRMKGNNELAVLFAERGMETPKPPDMLFVNDYVYECGCKDEFAISGFYVNGKRQKAFDVCDELALKKTQYGFSRELARSNLFYYLKPLAEYCPSFDWHRIAFEPDEGWVALNPSIALRVGHLYGVIRTVNYKIDEHGRYLIRGTDGTANSSNPINTRNFFVEFDQALHPLSAVELLLPSNLERKFDLVVGFEDMRLYDTPDALMVSATYREATPEGWCEIWTAKIDPDSKALTDVQPREHLPKVHEKNWMPITDGTGRWMYHLDEITDGHGSNLKLDCAFDIGSFGGGSQVIRFNGGWLGVIHEARQMPGKPTRYYSHRFVWLSGGFVLKKISRPFCLHEAGIEYVSGLSWLPNSFRQLAISYGFKDCEARIATINAGEVEKFLG